MTITKLNLISQKDFYTVDSIELDDYSFIIFPVSTKNYFTEIGFEMLVYMQNYIDTIDIEIETPISFMAFKEVEIHKLSDYSYDI